MTGKEVGDLLTRAMAEQPLSVAKQKLKEKREAEEKKEEKKNSKR